MKYAVRVLETVEREVTYLVDADSEDDAKGLCGNCEVHGSQEEWSMVKSFDLLSVEVLQ